MVAKPDEADLEWFGELVPDHPDVSTRPMFGNRAAFARDQMFLCLLGSDVAVRLDDQDRGELLLHEGSRAFEPVAGQVMREYVVLPAAWRDDLDLARSWVNRALRYALTLPPRKRR